MTQRPKRRVSGVDVKNMERKKAYGWDSSRTVGQSTKYVVVYDDFPVYSG